VALNYVPATSVQRRQTFLKVLECRAVGLPQITTRTDPNAAVVREGENGLLVEDSADQYAAAMQQLIDDPSLLSRLKRRAEEMRTAVTWKDVADRHLSIYASLREVRKRRAPSSAGAAQA
jgi:glycosyltransferase involved in cell wall biosynthesis